MERYRLYRLEVEGEGQINAVLRLAASNARHVRESVGLADDSRAARRTLPAARSQWVVTGRGVWLLLYRGAAPPGGSPVRVVVQTSDGLRFETCLPGHLLRWYADSGLLRLPVLLSLRPDAGILLRCLAGLLDYGDATTYPTFQQMASLLGYAAPYVSSSLNSLLELGFVGVVDGIPRRWYCTWAGRELLWRVVDV